MRAWLVLLAIAGCYGNPVRSCPDVICPLDLVCDNHGGCALREQIEECAGQDNGTACQYPGVVDGECSDQLCVPKGCGNGFITSDEVCDDGNTINGDGCSADCRSLETCGNDILDPAKNEQCDGTPNCRPDCTERRCGDGVVDPPFEACDDAADNSNDPNHCRINCQLPRCGDGVTDTDEVCDDGNSTSGDGCSADCKSKEECGDGILNVEKGETCDCGNPGITPGQNCAGKNNDATDATAPCRDTCKLRRCGDDIREGTEQCEGDDFGGVACEDLGFYGGELKCNPNCGFDIGACSGRCGDDAVDTAEGEDCDGDAHLGGNSCQLAGFYFGAAVCTSGCHVNFSGCSGRCGDGHLDQGFELCDGEEFGAATCATVDPGKSIGPATLLKCPKCDTIDTTLCAHPDDGKCDADKDETCMNSPKDCDKGQAGCCGNGQCSGAETFANCPADCK